MSEEEKKQTEEVVVEEKVDILEDAEAISEEVENVEKEVVIEDAETPSEEIPVAPEEAKKAKQIPKREYSFDLDAWHPKTDIGKKVKSGEIVSMNDVLDAGNRVLEPEIVEVLVPGLENDLLLIGQAKGKFGGGQRRVFRQCQKKTREGNKPSFSTLAITGNKNGIIGLGYGKARETVPAREKAFRNSKCNIIKIRRGSGSWEGSNDTPNSIPFKVRGKCGSVIVELIPAPDGTGLCIEQECAKMLRLAGIKDVWSKTHGQTKTKLNQAKACFEALKQLSTTKVQFKDREPLNIVEGQIVD